MWSFSVIITSVAITVAFIGLETKAYNAMYQRVSHDAHEVLPRFYLAAGVLRIMAALLILMAYCIVERDAAHIKTFAAIFVPCYMASLIVSTLFYANKEKQRDNKPKE